MNDRNDEQWIANDLKQAILTYPCSISECGWEDWTKLRKTSVSIAGVPAGIRTDYHRNLTLERYHLSQPLGVMGYPTQYSTILPWEEVSMLEVLSSLVYSGWTRNRFKWRWPDVSLFRYLLFKVRIILFLEWIINSSLVKIFLTMASY
jgi:hypothetical protein